MKVDPGRRLALVARFRVLRPSLAADHGYHIASVLLLNDHSGLGLRSHGNSFFVIICIVFYTQLSQHCGTVSVHRCIGIILGREDQVEF